MDNFLVFANIFAAGIIFTYIIILFIMGSNVKSTRMLAILNIGILIFLINIILKQLGYTGNSWYIKYASFFFPVLYILFLLTETLEKIRPVYFLFLLLPPLLTPFADNDFFHIIYHTVSWPLSMLFIYYIMKRYKMDNKAIKEKFFYFALLNIIIVFPFLIENTIFSIITREVRLNLTMFPLSFAVSSLISLALIYYRNLTRLNHVYYENLSFIKKVSTFEKRTIVEKVSAGLIHEIKNPLTAVKSLIQQLQDENEETENCEYYQIIEEEVLRMEQLCSSFLQLNKKEENNSGRRVYINDKIDEVVSLIGFEIKKKRIDLKVEVPGELSIVFNPYQFRQVLLNLMYNAIEAGATHINITAGQNGEKTEIVFTDNGKGISEHIKKSIFKPFFTTKKQGTGMGLVICREILHNNRGNLYIVDNEERTVFKIVIYREK